MLLHSALTKVKQKTLDFNNTLINVEISINKRCRTSADLFML